MMKCPNKNLPEYKEMASILGGPEAIAVWDKNNGHPLDKAPNGKDSKLFRDLEQMFGRGKAIEVKAKMYSEDYTTTNGDWYLEDTAVPTDSNNEPLTALAIDYEKNGPYQFDSLFTEQKDKDLANNLKSFAESVGINVQVVDSLTDKFDGNVIAVADIFDSSIKLAKGKYDVEAMHEEFGHFAIEAVGFEHPTIKRAMELVEQTKMWEDHHEEYMKAYGNNKQKVKAEILGKLMGQAIQSKSSETMTNEFEHNYSVMKRLNDMFDALVGYIKRLFKTTPDGYLDSLIIDSYGRLVTDVLKGNVTSDMKLNLKASREVYARVENVPETSKDPSERFKNDVNKFAKNASLKIFRRGDDIYANDKTTKGLLMSEKMKSKSRDINTKIKYDNHVEAMSNAIEAISSIIQEDKEILSRIVLTDSKDDPANIEAAEKIFAMSMGIGAYTEDLNNIKRSLGRLGKTPYTVGQIKVIDQLINAEADNVGQYNDIRVDLEMIFLDEEIQGFLKANPNKFTIDDVRKEFFIMAKKDINWYEGNLLSLSMSRDTVANALNNRFQNVHQDLRLNTQKFEKNIFRAHKALGQSSQEFMYDGSNQVSNFDSNKFYEKSSEFIKGLNKNVMENEDKPDRVFLNEKNSNPIRAISIFDSARMAHTTRGSALAFDEFYKEEYLIPITKFYMKNLDYPDSWTMPNMDSVDEMSDFIIRTKENIAIHAFQTERPTPSKKDYWSGKVDKMSAKQKAYYDVIMPIIVGRSETLGTGGLKFLMPQVEKGLKETLETEGASTTFKEAIASNVITRESDDNQYKEGVTESGDVRRNIPIRYTKYIKDSKRLSKDATTSTLAFMTEADKTDALRSVLPYFGIADKVLQDRKFEKSHILGGKASEMFTSQMDAWFYGNEKDRLEYTALGYDVRVDKLTSFAARYTASNALGLNLYAAIANPILGSFMLEQEARAKEFFNHKQLRGATMKYAADIGGVMKDIGTLLTDSKMRLYMEKTDALQDSDRHISDTRANRNRALRLVNHSHLFFMNHAGEHILRGITSIAMGEKWAEENGLKDSNGDPIGLYDAFEVVDNDIKIKSGVTKGDGSKVVKSDIIKFSQKMAHVNNLLHGIYNKVDSNAFQRTVLGSLAMMFRKFAIPGFIRRYGKSRYDAQLGYNREGQYVTAVNFVRGLFRDWKTINNDMEEGSLSATGKIKQQYDNLGEHEKANIRRSMTGLIQSAGMVIAAAILSNIAGEDDDDNWALQMANYQASRLRTELLFFVWPAETIRMFQSPMATVDQVDDIFKVLESMVDPFGEYQSGIYKGENKFLRQLKHRIPTWKTIGGYSDPARKAQFFNK